MHILIRILFKNMQNNMTRLFLLLMIVQLGSLYEQDKYEHIKCIINDLNTCGITQLILLVTFFIFTQIYTCYNYKGMKVFLSIMIKS